MGAQGKLRFGQAWTADLAGLLRQTPNSQNSVSTAYSLPKNILQPEFHPKNNLSPKQGCWAKLI